MAAEPEPDPIPVDEDEPKKCIRLISEAMSKRKLVIRNFRHGQKRGHSISMELCPPPFQMSFHCSPVAVIKNVYPVDERERNDIRDGTRISIRHLDYCGQPMPVEPLVICEGKDLPAAPCSNKRRRMLDVYLDFWEHKAFLEAEELRKKSLKSSMYDTLYYRRRKPKTYAELLKK